MANDERTATSRVTHEIVRFLESPKPEVLALRGEWGVGKTYLWNTLIAQTKVSIALKKYAYVSLFGLQSLNELKYSIFENTIDTKNIGIEPSLTTLKTNTDFVVETAGKHLLSILSRVRGASAALEAASFLAVKDRIICIDDLERRGSGLRIIDVLGLVSYLTEHRGCKVILILNDEALGEADKKDLARYQEKVIDLSLLFAPTEEECVDIALDKSVPTTHLLAGRCVALGVSNIRVIKKIERLFAHALPLLEEYDVKITEQAASTLTLFGWSHFSRTADDDDKFIEFVCQKRDDSLAGLGGANPSPQHDEWNNLLDAYGYSSTDDFDLALLDGVRRGFFDEERLKQNAEILDEKCDEMASTKSFSEAWALLYDSFKDNTRDVVRSLMKAFRHHTRFVTPSELNGAVSLLKSLGRDKAAEYALRLFMKRRGHEDYAFFDLSQHPFAEQIQDPDVVHAFSEKLKTFREVRSPEEILHTISFTHGWSAADTQLLESLSVDDYYDMFKRLENPRLRRIVGAALGFHAIRQQDPSYPAIADNSKAALIRIGRESPLNARRLIKYHITEQDLA